LVKAKNLFEGDYFLRRKKFKSKDEKKDDEFFTLFV